ncbi:MAG: transporter, partial [Myxococcales bacterium]|nr:transporter [Myxococcales bacterium]
MLRRLLCRGALASVLLALTTSTSQPARAAAPRGIQIETFEPLPETGLNLLNVSTSRMLERWRFAVGLTTHAAGESLSVVRTDADGTRVANLVDDRVTSELSLALGLFGHISLGAVLPVVLTQTGDDLAPIDRPGEAVGGGPTLGDVRAVARIRFWYPEDFGGFGLHFAFLASFPTGDRAELTSDGGVRFQPTLGVDYRDADGFTLAVNAGYLVRPRRTLRDVVVGEEVRWAVGVEVPAGLSDLSVLANVFGAYAIEANRDALDPTLPGGHHDHPVEVLGGLRLRPSSSVDLLLAGGAGVNGDVGAP